MDKEPSLIKAENMFDNIKIIKGMDKALILMPTEKNILENGENINIMAKEPTTILMEINMAVNGIKQNILNLNHQTFPLLDNMHQ